MPLPLNIPSLFIQIDLPAKRKVRSAGIKKPLHQQIAEKSGFLSSDFCKETINPPEKCDW